jgi:hypothetical protein
LEFLAVSYQPVERKMSKRGEKDWDLESKAFV